VKQIIQKHQGTVRAEGKLNEGAIFYVYLPKGI
jgi:signal transduction histidine kinase